MAGDAGRVARNVVLESLLTRVQWTPQDLAERLNALAAMLELRSQMNPRTAQRWVSGRAGRPVPPVPREPWPALVCLLLHRQSGQPVTPQMLGWPASRNLRHVPTADGLGRTCDGAGAITALSEVVEADTPEQDYVRESNESNPFEAGNSWVFDPVRVPASAQDQQIDHAVVENMEQLARSQRRLSAALGEMMSAPVRASLRLVVTLLQNYRYPQDVGRRLYALAVEFGRLAGWLAFDSDQPALAQRYLLAALRAAQVSGDCAAGADILGFLTVVAETPAVSCG